MNLTTRILRCLCAMCIVAASCASSVAQSTDSSAAFAELQKQLDAQARQIEDLQNRLNSRSEMHNATSNRSAESAAAPPSASEKTKEKTKVKRQRCQPRMALPLGMKGFTSCCGVQFLA